MLSFKRSNQALVVEAVEKAGGGGGVGKLRGRGI